jgi:ATP-dependent DNA helicase RecG
MTKSELKQIVSKGEGLTVELKLCKNGLTDSVFETVSSFSNRYGGHIILGVEDAICRRENLDRYDDRLIVSVNLIDAYERLIEFIAKHTLDRFFLIDGLSVSVRSKIAREIVSNSLVHREYSSAFPAKIIIERDQIVTENWNLPKHHGIINPENFTPYPKNPILASFFVNIGMADTLGSGVRNLYKFSKVYSGEEPKLVEGDIFKAFIPLTSSSLEKGTEINTVEETTDTVEKILNIISNNPHITQAQLAEITGLTRRGIEWNIQQLKAKGLIERIGADKGGHWKCLS